MDRKRTRSNSGCAALDASSSTRSLKRSHDSSRLMKRAGDDDVNATGGVAVAVGEVKAPPLLCAGGGW